MYDMLTGIDRAIKSEAYKKYDLPIFDKGGKTEEEPPVKGAKKKAYQDAIMSNVYEYLKRTNYKTPHVPGKTIDDLGREMNCIHGVCQIVEGAGAKKFSQEYFGNMVFDDNMKKEGFYYAQPETEGFEVGDFLRFARTKANANIMARYSGSVTPLNEDDLIPQHTSFILDKYKDDNGVTMYSIANNHGEEDVEINEVSEEELLQWTQKGKGSFDKMLIARYDPDKVAEDIEKSEKINKILSGENSYASKYSGKKPGVTLKEKDELGEELLKYYNKNYEKLGKSSDLPPEVLDKLFVKQIGIAKQESTTGSRSIGKSAVPDAMLPYARKVADALFDNDNWILDYWNKNADDVKSKFDSIKAFTDYVTKDLKLDKEAREYLRYNSPASKGMFQQKELSQRGRFHKSGFDTPEEQFISSMDLAIDNYHKLKDKYPDMFEPELVELTTLMHNSPFKALTPEYVNYYLKNQNIDYVNKVNNYIPAYDIDRPIEKESELQKFIQKHAKPLPDMKTANTVSPEEKKKIVNFLLNQNKKEYGGELDEYPDGGATSKVRAPKMPTSRQDAENMIANKELALTAPSNQGYEAIKNIVNTAGIGFYPAAVAGSIMDALEGNYKDAALGLIPFLGKAGKHGKLWGQVYTKAVKAGIPHKIAYPGKHILKGTSSGLSTGIQGLDFYNDNPYEVFGKEQKVYGGELDKFVDGGDKDKKGTKENPIELPEITITPETKQQMQYDEMYKYMPDDVKQAIAYDMENPDELSMPKEPTLLNRLGDYTNIGLHPFEALAHINQDRRKGNLFGSNWYEMKKQERGINPLDLALQGAAAARLAGAVLPTAMSWLNTPAVVAGTELPGATLGNFLASEGIASTLLRESGYSGDEDPSTVREWEKYKEGSQDLPTTLANTGVNLLDVGLTAFGDFKPFISETAKELKRDYKIMDNVFDPKTMRDVNAKILELKAKNPTTFTDAKEPFEELMRQKLEFWNTPEGRRRVQKYIDENMSGIPNYTVDDYIKEMSEIDYADPTEVIEQRNLRESRQNIINEKREKLLESNKILVNMHDEIKMMQQNRRSSNANSFMPEQERTLIEDYNRLKAEYEQEAQYLNNLYDLHKTETYFPENNAFYWGRLVIDKPRGPVIHVGEDYSLPSNLQNTLWHEFGHAQNLYPLDKRFRRLPRDIGVNFRLRNNLDFEDFATNSQKLTEYHRHKTAFEKGEYVPPDYVFPTEEQLLEWENNSMPSWLDESQFDLANMYENAEPISQGTLGQYRYENPKDYTASEFRYFQYHDEANAFLNELMPELMREGHIAKLGDKIEPEMLKQIFENYRNSGKTKMIEAVRLLDFVKPTEKSLKALAEELNNLQVLLIGAGGAKGLKAAGAFDNKETNIEQQKFGGNISNLQKFIR